MRDEDEGTFRHWLSPSLGITIGIEEDKFDHLGRIAPCEYGEVYLMKFSSSLQDACIVSKGVLLPSQSLLLLAHLSSCISSHHSFCYFSLTSHLTYHISPLFALLPREGAGNPSLMMGPVNRHD
jgi:hypothetical protein